MTTTPSVATAETGAATADCDWMGCAAQHGGGSSLAGGGSAGELGDGQPRQAVEGGRADSCEARRRPGLAGGVSAREHGRRHLQPGLMAGGEVAADRALRGAPSALG